MIPSAAERPDERGLAERADPYNVTQASRIYFLPNLMTAGNLFCGFMAVVNCIQARLAESLVHRRLPRRDRADHYRYAVWFIFGAAVFDSLDGRLARLGGRESLFGAEFDSLADVVSFGVAPALLMFFLILSPHPRIALVPRHRLVRRLYLPAVRGHAAGAVQRDHQPAAAPRARRS